MDKLYEYIDPSRYSEEDIRNKIRDLKSSKDLFEMLLNIVAEGIMVITQDLELVFINQCAKLLLSPDKWLSDGKVDASKCILQDIIENTKKMDFLTYHRELEILDPKLKYLDISCIPFEKTDTPLLIYLIKDITKKTMENDQKIMNPTFIDNLTFGAGIAHELGNPLASLSLHAQLLKRHFLKIDINNKETDEINKSINILNRELLRLDETITQFLDAVRPTNPQFGLSNINNAIKNTIETLDKKAKEKHVTFHLDLYEDEDFLIDEIRLKQAFTNILLNAIEASPKKGEIFISLKEKDDICIISFTDQGKGITPAEIGKIFDPYYTTKESGNGLGLLITYRIIKDHGGSISVKSNHGSGTSFILSIPVRKKAVKLLS